MSAPVSTTHWTVYIVQCVDGSLYTGIAKNVEARLHQHNAGKGAKYTRGRRPVVLLYTESVQGQGQALRREQAIKRLPLVKKRALIDATAITNKQRSE